MSLKVFDYSKIVKHLKPSPKIVSAIEYAFGQLSQGKVEVPMPMHIGIHEHGDVGPGDCHIKGGYVEGAKTWTVKLANVSFYKNVKKGMSPGSGVFITCDASNGLPLAVFHENRYLTDLRTGAAGAVSVKHFCSPKQTKVAYIGTGVIARAMADGTAAMASGTESLGTGKFTQGYAFGFDAKMNEAFAKDVHANCGYPVKVCATAEEAVREADVIFTQTPAGKTVLELGWLKSKVTIIASGSDQPTKNEIPSDVMKKSKFVCDLVRQCSKVGELRTAIKEGAMQESDVYCEIGDVVAGTKKGRVPEDGIILVDLTGTGAQDAAIGQEAWNVLSKV